MISLLKQQTIRAIKMNLTQKDVFLYPCVLFLTIIFFYPLTLSHLTIDIKFQVIGLIWVAVLFALFLSAERLFLQDYTEGMIEQWLVAGLPLGCYLYPKIIVDWLFVLVPLLLTTPLIGLFFNFSGYETGVLMLSLICGTPTIYFLCALMVALTASLQHKGVLMAILLFPLCVPILIFGSLSVSAAMEQLNVTAYLALLSGISVLAVGLLPFAIAGVFKICLND